MFGPRRRSSLCSEKRANSRTLGDRGRARCVARVEKVERGLNRKYTNRGRAKLREREAPSARRYRRSIVVRNCEANIRTSATLHRWVRGPRKSLGPPRDNKDPPDNLAREITLKCPHSDHGLDEAEGAAYHHHHSHHQQHHRHRHHHPLPVPPPHHHHQAQREDDQEQSAATTNTTITTTSSKYHRAQPDFRQQKMMREHHRQHGYGCPLCCRTLQDISAMRAHLDHHYPRDSPTCPVASCAKTFSHPNSVRNHMRLKHPVQWDQIKTLRWTYV
ncbi:hypothetical protein KM043_008410 [Ampulex compressa]|nr:hypothetical protein KM043_008410 [Ampulex compressa]